MVTNATLERFQKYSASLTLSCIQHPKIIGLVLLGSTAETSRVDQWSDHDFFVITEEGDQEELRQSLDWLPEHDSISFSFRETEHGLKTVYKSGAVLEFAIFSCDELRASTVNHHRLAYGDEKVEVALAEAFGKLPALPPGDDLADFRHFLSTILIQVGRARRGETINALQGIVASATTLLLRVLTRRLPFDARLDKLAVSRRFDLVHPELGAAIADALVQRPESAARSLLEIAEKYLKPHWPEYPRDEVNTVKDLLSWTS